VRNKEHSHVVAACRNPAVQIRLHALLVSHNRSGSPLPSSAGSIPRTTINSLSSGREWEEEISNVCRLAVALPLLLSRIAVSRTYLPGGAAKLRSNDIKPGALLAMLSADQRRAMSSLKRSTSVPELSLIVARNRKVR